MNIAPDIAEYLIKKNIEKDNLPSLSFAFSKNGEIIFQMAFGFADIIAVKRNPMTDISALEEVVFIMKDGKVYK